VASDATGNDVNNIGRWTPPFDCAFGIDVPNDHRSDPVEFDARILKIEIDGVTVQEHNTMRFVKRSDIIHLYWPTF